MNKFIYQDIVNEFDSYIDNNYPETIYIDTVNLCTTRDKNIYSLYTEIFKRKKYSFDDILNRKENTQFCSFVTENHKKSSFNDISYEIINKCNMDNDLYCKLNVLQIIGSNAKLNNKFLINDINKHIGNYPNTIRLSLKNVNILFSKDPYGDLIELVDFIKNDEKSERFYSSFIEFYYTNFKVVIDTAIESIRLSQVNYIAIFLPIICQAAKKELFPPGTKTALSTLLNAIKKLRKALPSELNDKYNFINEILEIDPENYTMHRSCNKEKNCQTKNTKSDG